MVSRKVRRFGLTLVAGVFFAGSGCSFRTQDDPQAQVLRSYLRDDVKSLDPASAYDSISLEVLPHIMESLYNYDPVSPEYRLVPQLAADFPLYSKDRLTVTIPLKKGVRFADHPCFKQSDGKGRELRAQDFVYAIRRLGHPGVQSTGAWIFEGRLKGFSEFQEKLRTLSGEDLSRAFEALPLEGVQAKDDLTLELRLTKPFPQLLYMLAMTFTAPVAPEVAKTCADQQGRLTDHPVGTGPFVLKTWNHGNEIVLARNPQFRQELVPSGMGLDVGKAYPFLSEVSFRVIKEDQPMWLGFQKGTLDLTRIPKDNFGATISSEGSLNPQMQARGIELKKAAGPVMYWVSFNMKDRILSNRSLRQALSSAIDRDRWIELFLKGRGRKQVTAAPEGLKDRVSDGRIKYDFNLERAKKLLAQAGYPQGKGLPILTLDMRGADSVNRQIGEFLSSQFEAIGVKLSVVYNTFPAFLEKTRNGSMQISLGGWFLDFPDVENVYQLLYGKNLPPGPNEASFKNEKYDALYERLASLEPGTERAKVVAELDSILQEEVPWALGYYRDEFTLHHPWVRNYVANPFLKDTLKFVRIDLAVKARMKN